MTENKSLSVWFYIKACISFRYLTNISFIVCMLAYYMNAIDIFFIFAPLVIVNFIMINIVQVFNFNELIIGLIGKEIPIKEDRDKVVPRFVLYNFI